MVFINAFRKMPGDENKQITFDGLDARKMKAQKKILFA